uniref:Uncharacterized protein n=1 Tax=Trypanosoma congolense (strain IL3000) TaxID=1068625 RepID=G0UZW8_TRYCI|nr:conserved hypothetical protein [Trypanosoma congolense IL3000]
MWTRRNVFPFTSLPKSACPAVASSLVAEESPTTDGKEGVITTLAYTLITDVLPEEALTILTWSMCGGDPLATIGWEGVKALNQIEYFLVGTSNGKLFVFPLFPPTIRPFISGKNREGPLAEATDQKQSIPWNAGCRRLLHEHRPGECVTDLATLGRLVASCAPDAYLHVSMFHPMAQHVVTVRHPAPLRCVLLWEGAVFLSRLHDPGRRDAAATAECCVVYIITGDEKGIVRIWRADVETGDYFLLAVLVVVTTAGFTGFASPLHCIVREDARGEYTNRKPTAETTRQSKTLYALVIDEDQRLLAGVEGGIVVWSLADLPYKGRERDHLLCWDSEKMLMERRATSLLRIRGERLVNMNVWVKSEVLLRECLSGNLDDGVKSNECTNGSTQDECGSVEYAGKMAGVPTGISSFSGWQPSKWKAKYGTHVAGGSDIGVVSNVVSFPSAEDGKDASAGSLLRTACVPIIFPSLKNVVYFPLLSVEPVFAPMRVLTCAGRTCMALLALAPGRRIVSSGSDGVVTLWLWNAAEETYVKAIASGESHCHRGVSRCLSVLREPDIFLSYGYEDGVIREWHVYDEPELFMWCQRTFVLSPASCGSNSHLSFVPEQLTARIGVACAVSFPDFCALFLAGVGEGSIFVFGLVEVQGCDLPAGYIFNGYKTVRAADVKCDGLRHSEDV